MKQVLKRLIKSIYDFRIGFILGILGVILLTALNLWIPLIGRRMIDDVLTPVSLGRPINTSLLVKLLAMYVGVNIISTILSYASRLKLQYVSNDIVKQMRNQLLEKMNQLPVKYFDEHPAGSIVSRLINDTEVLRKDFYVRVIADLLISCISIIGTYVMLFYLDFRLATALLLILPIIFIWQHLYTKYMTPIQISVREKISELNSKINEYLTGVTLIQMFQKEQHFLYLFKKNSKEIFDLNRRSIFAQSLFVWGFGDILRDGTILIFLLYISQGYITGQMAITAGMLYVFIDYINRLFAPVQMFVNGISNIQQSLATGKRVFEFMDEPVESFETNRFEIKEGKVRFEDIMFSYKEGEPILKRINLNVQSGETIGLVGTTGSGKSTLLNLLFRYYEPDSGQIYIDDIPISEVNRHQMRQDMAIVLQDPYLFTGTIASNIRMNQTDLSDDDVRKVLEQVGAGYLIENYKEGIYHEVREHGADFSSGERQLISFARALAAKPKILMLDEATSHVDTETEQIIQQAMDVLKEGRTTFIIAHRLSTIQNADRIVVISNGEIVEIGKHEDLLNNRGIYYTMYMNQKEKSSSC
ncbi:ABC transporter ATP-binding protein [Atopobacter phocae]|uniref:ABC transporter ATP-binding protein n=1 Tax=Atopobacter phocae TaxID=136492 RepID=UPI00047285C2|nr:ABC transporter ATP-binding protein [Atopobacter phocae]